LAVKSEQYRAKLAKGEGKDLPFDTVIAANIGNPQQLDQKPITFFRQVASLLENPSLLEHEDVLTGSLEYKSDVIARAKKLLKEIKSVGAYSQSQGAPGIRQSVAEYIERRDGYPASFENIYLSNGASSGVNTLLHTICAKPETGIMVPIPQYPLYTATLSVLDARCVPYYLDEENAWGTSLDAIRASHEKAVKEGTDVKAICVINPGNPTGASLPAEDIRAVLKFAAEKGLVVVADEVYQSTFSLMDLNNDNINDTTELRARGNWNEIKGAAKQKWGQLTDDDLTYDEGKQDEWFGNLQQKTGHAIDEIKDWFSKTFSGTDNDPNRPSNRTNY